MIRLHTAVLGAVALLVTLVAGAPALAGPHDDAISGESGEPGSKWEIGYALGLSTALSANVTAGVELKDFEGKAYAIPGLYVTLGAGKRLNIGTAFGLNGKADDFQLKTIVEYEMF